MAWTARRTRHQVKVCIDRFQLIEKGGKAVVGVSGGPDSLCLLHLLADLNRRLRRNWQLHAVHVDPGFETWDSSRVVRACERIGVPCIAKKLDVPARLKQTGNDECFFCARERRKTLFLTAHELGTDRVCLGHHMDDVNETYLMNLMMASSGATFVPRQELFKGEIVICRPLYYLEKPMITDYLKEVRVRPRRNRCPYEKTGTRLRVRRFLDRLYRKDRRVRTNIFWGIHNLKPHYLPRPAPGGRKRT